MQESSAELWLTMRVMPTVDKTAQVRAGPESTVQHTGFLSVFWVQLPRPVRWWSGKPFTLDSECITFPHGA